MITSVPVKLKTQFYIIFFQILNKQDGGAGYYAESYLAPADAGSGTTNYHSNLL